MDLIIYRPKAENVLCCFLTPFQIPSKSAQMAGNVGELQLNPFINGVMSHSSCSLCSYLKVLDCCLGEKNDSILGLFNLMLYCINKICFESRNLNVLNTHMHTKNMWGDGYVNYLDGGNHSNVHIYQITTMYTSKYLMISFVNDTSIKVKVFWKVKYPSKLTSGDTAANLGRYLFPD